MGENYLKSGFNGKKILVLGESHYCTKELAEGGRCCPLCRIENMESDCFSQTEDVIDHFVYNYSGEPYAQTFLCFERSMMGKELSNDERIEFWNSIIFYNYIQFSQARPRIAPQQIHWEKSELAFLELLKKYMPDFIIIWGERLYNGLPDWDGSHSVLEVDGKSTDVWTYNINGKSIPAIKVHHPSSPLGKRWLYWNRFYNAFFEKYK